MHSTKIIKTMALLAGFLPCSAHAESSQELPAVVVTSTMSEQLLDRAAGTVEIISKDQIEALGAEDVADVLQQAAGITLLSGSGRSQEVSIRGMGSGHTLILIDGRRITGGFNAAVDTKQIPVISIDHIEIIRGPSSALYGSEATGGVINIITKKPLQKSEASLDVRGAIGEAAEQSAQAMAGSSYGPLRVNLAAGHYKQDGYNTDIDTSQEIDDTTLDTVSTRAALDLPEGQTLSLGGEWGKFDRDGIRYYLNKYRIRNGEDKRAGGYLQFDSATDASWTTMARLYGNSSKGTYAFTPAADSAENERDLIQAEIRSSHALTDTVLFTVGAEAREQGLDGTQLISGYNDVSEDNGALFSQFQWNPTTPFDIVASLRYDDYEDSGSHLSPRIIASYLLPTTFSSKIWTSFGEGFRAATLDELYGKVTKKQGKYIYYGNDDLDPETSQSYETGFSLHTENIRSQFVVFYNDIDDLIEAENKGTSNGTTSYMYENVNEAETYGIEFDSHVDITSSLGFSGNATWLQSKNKDTGYELATEPEWKGHLSATYKIPLVAVEAELRYSYFGDCEDGTGGAIDGYQLVGFSLKKQLTSRLEIYGGSENLFNEENDYFYQTPLQVYLGISFSL